MHRLSNSNKASAFGTVATKWGVGELRLNPPVICGHWRLWTPVPCGVGHKGPETGAFSGHAAETRKTAENQDCLVELSGIEPLTSSLRTTRSPN
jgi:hypothetical protein